MELPNGYGIFSKLIGNPTYQETDQVSTLIFRVPRNKLKKIHFITKPELFFYHDKRMNVQFDENDAKYSILFCTKFTNLVCRVFSIIKPCFYKGFMI